VGQAMIAGADQAPYQVRLLGALSAMPTRGKGV
jgi:hypothetical protein